MTQRDVNDASEVYYTGSYWNDLDCTNRMINRRISGDEAVNWWRHFASHSGRVFERALILNCGNGWVEREMFDGGLFKEAVGIDCSQRLLNEARAATEGRPLRYLPMDVNADDLPNDSFDLVVNHAAGHHVTRIDRLFRRICALLPEEGWFISLDYVGPHRNQYSVDAWNESWILNQALPHHLRQTMEYPLLPLMLEVDASEAVHSELIVETLYRYFKVSELVPLGGALAYPVLTHNEQLFSEAVPTVEREQWGQVVLDQDADYLDRHPDSSLFAYFTAQPNKNTLLDRKALAAWQAAEDLREAQAAENGGKYYEASMLSEVYWALAVNGQAAHDVRGEIQAIRASFLYSHLTRMLGKPVVHRLHAKLAHVLKRNQSHSR